MKKPKLLLDENIGLLVADKLKSDGFDVLNIVDGWQGTKDVLVLKLALKERRVLVTLDKDFGQLIYADSRKHAGVVFLRLNDQSPQNVYKILSLLLKQHGEKLKNKFAATTEDKIRLR